MQQIKKGSNTQDSSMVENSADRVINKLNKGFLVVILSVIFYGAFRKWFLPGLSNVIYFVPELIIAWIYFYAFKYKLYPGKFLDKMFYGVFVVLLFLATIQSIVLETLMIPLFGFRNYCFILPLVVLMYTYLTEEYMRKIALYLCIIAIPTAMLVYYQSVSPVDSFINRSVGEGTNQRIFVVVDGVARTTGFFSFNTGHSLYTFTTLGLFVYLLFDKNAVQKIWLSAAVIISITTCVIVSGSRSNYVVSGVGIAVFVLSQLGTFRHRKSLIALGISVFVVIGGYFLVNTFYKKNLANINQRFETADNVSDRVTGQLKIDELMVPLAHNLPSLGYGMGIASPGARLGFGQRLPIAFGFEVEWARYFVEIGVFFGLVLIILRICLVVYLVKDSFQAFMQNRNPASLVLCSMFTYNLLIGQISMNALTMYFTWFVFAFCIAMNRITTENR